MWNQINGTHHTYEAYDRIDSEFTAYSINLFNENEHIAVVYVFPSRVVEILPAYDNEREEEFLAPYHDELKKLGLLLACQEGFFAEGEVYEC